MFNSCVKPLISLCIVCVKTNNNSTTSFIKALGVGNCVALPQVFRSFYTIHIPSFLLNYNLLKLYLSLLSTHLTTTSTNILITTRKVSI